MKKKLKILQIGKSKAIIIPAFFHKNLEEVKAESEIENTEMKIVIKGKLKKESL